DRKAPEANFLMGRSLLGLKQPLNALTYLEVAYSQDKSFKYMEPMDRACLETGTAKFVRAAYKSSGLISKIRPSVGISLIYAQAPLELGYPDECSAEMSRVLSNPKQFILNPSDRAKVLYLLSQAESALGKTEHAKDLEKQAFKSDPKAPEELRIMMIQQDSEK